MDILPSLLCLNHIPNSKKTSVRLAMLQNSGPTTVGVCTGSCNSHTPDLCPQEAWHSQDLALSSFNPTHLYSKGNKKKLASTATRTIWGSSNNSFRISKVLETL